MDIVHTAAGDVVVVVDSVAGMAQAADVVVDSVAGIVHTADVVDDGSVAGIAHTAAVDVAAAVQQQGAAGPRCKKADDFEDTFQPLECFKEVSE